MKNLFQKLFTQQASFLRAFHCFHGCFNTLVTEVELFAGLESQNYKSQLPILCRLNTSLFLATHDAEKSPCVIQGWQ